MLILEAGDNHFPGLDDPTAAACPWPLYSNDELKLADRASSTARIPSSSRAPSGRASGDAAAAERGRERPDPQRRRRRGALRHEVIRASTTVDFHIASALAEAGRATRGHQLRRLAAHLRRARAVLHGSREASPASPALAGSDPFASRRVRRTVSDAAVGGDVRRRLLLGQRRTQAGYAPFQLPGGDQLARPTRRSRRCSGRRASTAASAPATAARATPRARRRSPRCARRCSPARCQLRYNCARPRACVDVAAGTITGVEYVDPNGERAHGHRRPRHPRRQRHRERAAVLAVGSRRPGRRQSGVHLGRHMMFHLQTNGVGIFKQRIHGERGRSVTNGIADFRGVNEGGTDLHPDGRPLGGIIEFGTSSEPIGTAKSSKQALDVAANIPSIRDVTLKQLLRREPVPRPHRGDDHAGARTRRRRRTASTSIPPCAMSSACRSCALTYTQPSLRARRGGVLQAEAGRDHAPGRRRSSGSSIRPRGTAAQPRTSSAACAWAARPRSRSPTLRQAARLRQPVLHGRRRHADRLGYNPDPDADHPRPALRRPYRRPREPRAAHRPGTTRLLTVGWRIVDSPRVRL